MFSADLKANLNEIFEAEICLLKAVVNHVLLIF